MFWCSICSLALTRSHCVECVQVVVHNTGQYLSGTAGLPSGDPRLPAPPPLPHLQQGQQSTLHCIIKLKTPQIRHQFDGELWHQLDSVLRKGQLGDWFVLYQLTKNSSRHFYREFIRGLDADLKQAPKWSLSNQGLNLFVDFHQNSVVTEAYITSLR